MFDYDQASEAYNQGRMKLAQQMTETCRYWLARKMNRCDDPAVVITWGKLVDRDDLGPRCEKHLPDFLAQDPRWEQYAVFDLRPALQVLNDTDS